MGRRVFTAILPGVSLSPYLSTISTAAVVSSTSLNSIHSDSTGHASRYSVHGDSTGHVSRL